MDLLQTTNAIVISIGIPAIIGGGIYIGKKLQMLDSIEKSVETLKHNLKIVTDFLTKTASGFNSSELHNYSPIQLTENGKDFIEKLGFDTIFNEHKNDFFVCMDEDNPKLKYDVETAAIKSIHFLADKPYMDFLKIYLYNNPERNLNNVAPTLGVYVRDAYLAVHPEIIK